MSAIVSAVGFYAPKLSLLPGHLRASKEVAWRAVEFCHWGIFRGISWLPLGSPEFLVKIHIRVASLCLSWVHFHFVSFSQTLWNNAAYDLPPRVAVPALALLMTDLALGRHALQLKRAIRAVANRQTLAAARRNRRAKNRARAAK